MKTILLKDALSNNKITENLLAILPEATPSQKGLQSANGLIIHGNKSFEDINADNILNGVFRYQFPNDYQNRNLPFPYGCLFTAISSVVGFQLCSSMDSRFAIRTKWNGWSKWKVIKGEDII